MVNIRRVLPLCLVLLFGISACANVSAVSSKSLARPSQLPLPLKEPCTYPSSQELQSLAAASDVVIEAMVVDTVQSGSIGNSYFWTYHLSDGRMLGRKPTATALPPTTVVETGGSLNIILPIGHYILFLTDSDGWFTLTNGMKGRFPVSSSGVVLRECANYFDPVHPLTAGGAPMPIGQFELEIPAILPPRNFVPK